MNPTVGDRIAVELEKAGKPAREGVVLEVLEADDGTRYRVAWDDGHESTFHPTGGSVRVVEPEETSSKPAD